MTRRVLWAVPGFIALHSAEELLTMPHYLPVAEAHAPKVLQPVLAGMPVPALLGAVAFVALLAFALAAWADRCPESFAARWSVALMQAVTALNVAWHVGGAIVLGGYAPGVVTAVVFNLPFSVYFFRRVARSSWLSRRALWATAPAAVVLHGPGLVLLWALTREIAAM